MPASNAGTGHRIAPRCFWCARKLWNHGYDLRLTGRRKKSFTGNNVSRRVDPQYQYEIVCNDCGKTGWSRHVLIKLRWEDKEFSSKKTRGEKK